MRMENTTEKGETIDELQARGMAIYDSFCERQILIKRMTPRTYTLELFARLSSLNKNRLLYREMMQEFMQNLDDTKIFMVGGKLYEEKSVGEELQEISAAT